MPFQKLFARKKFNKKPRQLNLKEMWDLYRTLRTGLQGQSREYLMDELLQMMGNISVEEFKSALRQLYGELDFSVTPVELSLLLTRGIKKNELFSFSDFVKVMSGSSK